MNRARSAYLGGLLLLVAALAIGCSSQDGEHAAEAAADHAADAVESHAGHAHAQDAINVILAGADAADGTTDKVVSKCAGCKLNMDGSADYALTVGDYKMQFCGEDCKGHFAEDTDKAVMAMKE